MGAYDELGEDARAKVDALLAETRANNGLAPVDIERFWEDQRVAQQDPFGKDIPQVPLGAILTWECVFAELGVDQQWLRYSRDNDWAIDLNRRYNDLSEKIVGRRLLSENKSDGGPSWPRVKDLADLFEAENVWEGGETGSWWLKQSADTPAELAALLDRVEKRLEDLRAFMLPENWAETKEEMEALGRKPPRYRHQRGPCTFACSIYGVENLLLLYYDDPGLMKRFSDVLGRAILGRARVLDEEGGFTPETAPKGWSWFDDNSSLFTPDMYETFAMPIHRAVFARYAPEPGHSRYQHSDSDMAHLLPLLGELDLTGTNFGPTLRVGQIRRHLPHAVIHGQLAPFTYCRNEQANIVAEFLRDYEEAREARGLYFATAGSVNNGSRLTGMRLLMAAIQRYGRYDS